MKTTNYAGIDKRTDFMKEPYYAFRQDHARAIRELIQYSESDPIEFERLNPLLSAIDDCDWAKAYSLTESIATYRACSIFIDDLYVELSKRSAAYVENPQPGN